MRSDEFMNAEDVARYLNLGKNTVYQLAKTGKIASYHVGRKLKFTLEDVESYVASTHHVQESGAANRASVSIVTGGDESLSEAASFGELGGTPFVIAGGDASADMLASVLNASGMPAARKVCGSYTALVNLYAGDADAAVVHLYDQDSNSCNIPYVRRLAPGASVVVLRLYGCQQGLIVRSGNPKNLTTWGSLLREGVRIANRSKGSSARVLLDEKLRSLDARVEGIEGYGSSYKVGAAAARRVGSGVADAAIGTEREIRGISGVQFVPMQMEWIDLVVRKTPEARPLIKRINEPLAGGQLLAEISTLQPCDTSKFGAIVYES